MIKVMYLYYGIGNWIRINYYDRKKINLADNKNIYKFWFFNKKLFHVYITKISVGLNRFLLLKSLEKI